MGATLATLRDRVERVLADTGNDIWGTDDVDEGIRQALHEYSRARPQDAIGTLTLPADGREIDVSSLTGVLDVTEVWCDYTAGDPEFPPNRRGFEYWPDWQTVYVTDDYEPQGGDVARVFYTKMQTLNGLDAETSTSFPDDDESLLVVGASGYAATSRAVDLAEQVTLDRLTAQQIRAWGLSQLQRFRSGLKEVARRRGMARTARVGVEGLDRWDKTGEEGGWA